LRDSCTLAPLAETRHVGLKSEPQGAEGVLWVGLQSDKTASLDTIRLHQL